MLHNDELISELLKPLDGDVITGVDPRSDISPTSRYYFLKDIRNVARANERNILIEDESILTIAHEWKPIMEQVPDILKNESKDLEFIAWYIEALCRLKGFSGLAFGFELAAELISAFWDDLYPTPDEGDLSERLAPLIGLNGIDSEGSLIMPIKAIYITDGSSFGPFSIWEYEQALDVDRLDEEKQRKKFESGVVPLEDIEVAIRETSKEFYKKLMLDIQHAASAFSRLSIAMDKAMNDEPQPTSYISKTLESSITSLKHLTADILDEDITEGASQDADFSDENAVVVNEEITHQVVKVKEINSRENAIETLSEIAKYFRKTEPHSPMSYTIEQVIRWSHLPLPELLEELITDGDARNGFFKLSGIKSSTE